MMTIIEKQNRRCRLHQYTLSHSDLMVKVVEMLVPAPLHFGLERTTSFGVTGVHIGAKVAAKNLGLVENALHW